MNIEEMTDPYASPARSRQRFAYTDGVGPKYGDSGQIKLPILKKCTSFVIAIIYIHTYISTSKLGSKRGLVLSLVEYASESNFNCSLLVKLIQLEKLKRSADLQLYYTFDLKLANR